MADGLDPLTQALVQKATQDCLDQLMKGRHGKRQVYVLVVVAEGPHACKSHAYSPMNNAVAYQFADAIEHEADTVRTAAQQGLMATAQAVAASKTAKLRGG